MSYEDIVEARKKRDLKTAKSDRRVREPEPKPKPKPKLEASHPRAKKRAPKDELVLAEQEVVASGLADFCAVFRL